MQKARFKSILLGWILIWTFISYETWFFEETETSHLVGLSLRLVLPLLLFVFFKKTMPAGRVRPYFFFYGLLLLYTTIFTFASFDLASFEQFYAAMYLLLFFAGLILILDPKRIHSEFILKAPCYLGFFFAVQVLLLCLFLQLDISVPSHSTILAGNNIPEIDYGVLGYLAKGDFRAKSFFGEPSNFAAFMEISFFLSLGFYRVMRSRFMMCNIVLSFLAIVFSYSMTAFVAVFLTFFLWFTVKVVNKVGNLRVIFLPILGFLCVGTVIGYLVLFTSNSALANGSFGHSSGELTIRIVMFWNSLTIFTQHPLGLGFHPLLDGKADGLQVGSVMAPLLWLVRGGIFGILLQLSVMIYTFKCYVIPYVKQDGMQKYCALAFVSYVFHQCLAGDWFDPVFFYLLAMMVVYFPKYINQRKHR